MAGESLIPPPLFADQSEEGLKHFRELKIVDAPGSPSFGAACRPWLIDFVGTVFGAYDQDTGRRLITEWFLLISKKNMKSTGAAGLMMSALIWNWRESAEFLIVAPTIEIANNSFYPARDMVRKDPDLSALMHVQEHYRTITHRTTNAVLKVVAADSEAVSGKKATGILIDELWIFGKRPGAENMLREATGGLASRPEGFVVYLSTQSDEAPAGVFRQKLQYARGVRDGRIQDHRFLPVLYEFPKSVVDAGGHLKLENFHLTNPNLGVSVDQEYLRRELQKAEEAGAESLCGFLAKHANVEIGLALRSDRWAGADFWTSAADKTLTFERLLERSEVCTVGIDGGGLDDLLGLCVMGRDRKTKRWLAWTRAYAHPSVLARRKSEVTKLEQFQADGDLVFVDQIGEDVAAVTEIVVRVKDARLLDKIGVDAVGIGAIVDALVEAGIKIDSQIVAISQGWKLNGAIKTVERKLAGGELFHAGSSLMDWSVGNAKVEPKGNAISITKQASGTAKIDPLMALFNAAQLMSMNPQAMANYELHFV